MMFILMVKVKVVQLTTIEIVFNKLVIVLVLVFERTDVQDLKLPWLLIRKTCDWRVSIYWKLIIIVHSFRFTWKITKFVVLLVILEIIDLRLATSDLLILEIPIINRADVIKSIREWRRYLLVLIESHNAPISWYLWNIVVIIKVFYFFLRIFWMIIKSNKAFLTVKRYVMWMII